ncbi:hypothetical protein THIAE_08470 [Thiomicrospira aerophila AL3]|uniref:Uncharacterized protein n=1 Tax=Thiomicrospira aerophila AL3 TaxID=717772 RepID=W0DV91_9GAMM|nr:ShlB/FhaC/HecB family hemolysin secretion/activation protein [Thiomicrospira aerophila]AHF02362.1 hypothetical protein THIAE_08470 [Thiomicrospira aerophila AL3]
MHKKKINASKTLLVLTTAALVTPVLAQTPDAGSLLRDIETQQRGIDRLPDAQSRLPAPLPDTGATIQLRSISFQGYEGMATERELLNLVNDQIGQSLGFNGLQHIADRVTEYLKNKGYFLAFAYLPEQDISEGDLLILIQPGRIDGDGRWSHVIENTEINLSEQRIVNTLNHALKADSGGVVQANQLERGLLIFNDLAGVAARSNLQAGSEVGTTRVNVLLDATPRYTGAAWVDNYGNRYTGEWRANAMGNINNLAGMGDQLSLMASVSTETFTEDLALKYARLGYSLPVGYSGLMLNTHISYLEYELGRELKGDGFEGSARTAGLELRYPIFRSRLNNLYATAGFDYKQLEDRQLSLQIRDRVYNTATIGLNGDRLDQFGGGGLTNYGIRFSSGHLNRKGNRGDFEQDQTGPATHGDFTKSVLNIARLQKLTARTSLLATANAQFSTTNLDSAEKFSLGGPNGVRAYPGGEASGDKGYLLTLEGRYDLPQPVFNGQLQLVAFVDHGEITLQAAKWDSYVPANDNGKNSYSITGVGVGANWSFSQNISVRASYAHKANDEVDNRSTTGRDSEGQKNDGRFWLQAMARF